jgi:hypothetical protein
MSGTLTRILFGMAAVALLAAGTPALGSIVASDSFSYDPVNSSLTGKNGGTGWGGPWSSIASALIVDPAVDLTANGINGGNRALQLTVNDSNAAYRSLASPFSGAELLVSYLFRVDAGVINSNDFLALWLDTITSGQHSGNRPNIGLRGNSGTGNPNNPDYFVRFNIGGEDYSATQATVGETVQVVGRLQKTGVSTTFNEIDLWINPSPTSLATPDASVTVGPSLGGYLSSFSAVGLRTASLDGNDRLLLDELVLATTFSDVVRSDVAAIPEPAAIFVWVGLAGTCLVWTRKLRSSC